MKQFVCLLSTFFVFTHSFGNDENIDCIDEVVSFAQVAKAFAHTVHEEETPVSPLSLIAEGNTLVVGIQWFDGEEHADNRHGSVNFFDVETLELISNIDTKPAVPTNFFTLPEKPTQFGVLFYPDLPHMFDVQDGKIETLYTIRPDFSHRALVRGAPGQLHEFSPVADSIEVSPDGTKLLANYVSDAFLINSNTGEVEHPIHIDLNEVENPMAGIGNLQHSCFSHESHYVFTVHQWGMGSVWDAVSGKLITGFEYPGVPIQQRPHINHSKHDSLFVTYGMKRDNEQTSQMEPHTSPTQVTLYRWEDTRSDDDTAPEVSIKELGRLYVENSEEFFPQITFASDSSILISNRSGDIEIFDGNEGLDNPQRTLRAPNKQLVDKIEVSPQDDWIASAYDDGTVALWSSEVFIPNYSFKLLQEKEHVVKFVFSPNLKWLFIQTRENPAADIGKQQPVFRYYRVDLTRLSSVN